MERSQLYEYNDLIVCRYLKFKKTPDDNVLANRKFTIHNHIKIIIRLYEYLLFSLNSAGNLTLFLTLKGNNSYKPYNFIINIENVQMVYYIQSCFIHVLHCVLFTQIKYTQWHCIIQGNSTLYQNAVL